MFITSFLLSLFDVMSAYGLTGRINHIFSHMTGEWRGAGSTHYELLAAALRASCVCGGKAAPGWEHVLHVNSINVEQYKASVVKLFREGGGKGLNHFYTGEPSSGKSALVRSRPLSWEYLLYRSVKSRGASLRYASVLQSE
jgi:hypothetical protein